jgi:hypothetical protein
MRFPPSFNLTFRRVDMFTRIDNGLVSTGKLQSSLALGVTKVLRPWRTTNRPRHKLVDRSPGLIAIEIAVFVSWRSRASPS